MIQQQIPRYITVFYLPQGNSDQPKRSRLPGNAWPEVLEDPGLAIGGFSQLPQGEPVWYHTTIPN